MADDEFPMSNEPLERPGSKFVGMIHQKGLRFVVIGPDGKEVPMGPDEQAMIDRAGRRMVKEKRDRN